MRSIAETTVLIKDQLSRKEPRLLPAEHWQMLESRHLNFLEKWDFDNFKRTVNFEYGQWAIFGFFDPRIRALLKYLRGAGISIPHPFSGKFVGSHRVPKGVIFRNLPFFQRAYRWYLTLLYEAVHPLDTLRCLDELKEPLLGNPLLVEYKGHTLTQDFLASTWELNRIAKHMSFATPRRVAEIGSGYGRLAWLTAARFPQTEVHLFDIGPALAVGERYLTAVFGENAVAPIRDYESYQEIADKTRGKRIKLFMPHHLALFPDSHFDLMINISSFDEMSEIQRKVYFEAVDRTGGGFVYLKGYAKKVDRFTGVKVDARRYPYPARWKSLHYGQDICSPRFCEELFQIRPAAR